MRPVRTAARRDIRTRLVLLITTLALCSPLPAHAQSDDTTARLIELLVQKGVLTRNQARELLSEARAPTRPRTAQARPAPADNKNVANTAAEKTEPPPPKGTVRVTYVPKAVRDQIASEVKEQLQAESAAPASATAAGGPSDWTQRIHISGDVRIRGERTFYDKNNSTQVVDFNSLNALSNGYDDTGTTAPPLLNTTQDRNLFRIRARLNVAADITPWLDADVRIGTGNDTSPVSLNQTVGNPGDFQKYALWLDQAYLRFKPFEYLTVDVGRAPKPFWTTELLFYRDLSFDGASAQLDYNLNRHLNLFFNGGAFPVYNTAYNFGTAANSQPGTANGTSYPSHDAYLFAAQAGAQYRFNDEHLLKGAVGFFDFYNVQGEPSAPCVSPTAFGSCSTDNTRAPFVQFGNTVFPLRNIVPSTSATITPDPQFYGLASRFDLLDLHAAYTFHKYAPIDVGIDADYVKNLGFNRNAIVAKSPPNNLSSNNVYAGGSNGYGVTVNVGHAQLEKLWDWNVAMTYKYIESDAVLDALTDPNFHYGGTNAKGYIVEGNLALNRNVWFTGSWLSANQVSGPPYAVNVLLVDLNAKF